MSAIHIQSPTRVDLAGGTLDLWPLYNFIGSATTVNVAIDIFSDARISPTITKKIIIESRDLNYKKEFSSISEIFSTKDAELSFYLPLIDFFSAQLKTRNGFHLVTQSQSPVGGGLGGSSSLMISCLKVFFKWTDQVLPESHQLVHIAHNLEAKILGTPTGTQDYYPAHSGGLNILKYSATGIEQKILPISNSPLRDHFLLVYTGRSHHSGINNFEVLKAAVAKDPKTMRALENLSQIALATAEACEKSDWSEIPRLFNQEYENRVLLSESFSSPEIRKLKEISLKSGAQAIKICGAGGGGCVLLWTEKHSRSKVIKECQTEGFQVLNSLPVDLN